ncbi:MAG: hypothetical protein K0S33_2091 [Bacteroidetes bacterium]|jgi:hypothetical protein|nr:hypothetical protein [Bacteroidota bacterium]
MCGRKLMILACVLFCLETKAQTNDLSFEQQYELVQKVDMNYSSMPERIKEIDQLLASGKITRKSYIADLYAMQAGSLIALHKNKLWEYTENKPDSGTQKILTEIYDLYNKAVDTCTGCTPKYIFKRYEFEAGYDFLESKTEADLQQLKTFGYKPDKEGISAGLTYSHSKRSDYIGIEFGAASFYTPVYQLLSRDPDTGVEEVVDDNIAPICFHVFVAGFNKNISRQGYEVWLSPMQMTSPLMINVTKFGFSEHYISGQKPLWFYRPEIGLGWGAFSVNWGYSIYLKKDTRKDYSYSSFTARVSFPFYNYFKK